MPMGKTQKDLLWNLCQEFISVRSHVTGQVRYFPLLRRTAEAFEYAGSHGVTIRVYND